MDTNNKLAIVNPSVNIQQLGNSDVKKISDFVPMVKVNPTYVTVESWREHKKLKGFYMGTDIIPNEDGEAVTVVVVYGVLGKEETTPSVYIAGQAILVGSLRKLPATDRNNGVLTAVEIVHTGKKKAKKGHCQTFDVFLCKSKESE